jgi:CheY-like chemotaxis protein
MTAPDAVPVVARSRSSAGDPAGSGAANLQPFQRFDVILLDIMMRRSNGVDVAVELRRRFGEVESAESSERGGSRSASSGGDGGGGATTSRSDGGMPRSASTAASAPGVGSDAARPRSSKVRPRPEPPADLDFTTSSDATCSTGSAAPATARKSVVGHRRRGERSMLPPIVAMTGNTSLQDVETYRRAGFRHVLPKPFDIASLQALLVQCRR